MNVNYKFRNINLKIPYGETKIIIKNQITFRIIPC